MSSFFAATTTSTGDARNLSSAKPLDVISPERKDAFCEFVLSLPRKCSPTICGIIQLPPPSMNETLLQTSESLRNDDEEDVPMETSSFQVNTEQEDGEELDEDDRQLMSNGSSNNSALKDSIWSIDEYSELYGGDFDNVHELEHFHEYESEQLSKHLDNESRLFFSQPSINPSPVADRSTTNTSARCSEEENKENFHSVRRSTASFIRYIDTLESMSGKANHQNQVGEFDHLQMMAATTTTPTNKGNQSATDYEFHNELDEQQEQLDSGNFHETTANKRTPCKQRPGRQQYFHHQQQHSKMSFAESLSDFDSDVFSGTTTNYINTTTTMDISFEQSSLGNLSASAGAAMSSSGGGIILNHRCGGLSKFESHSLQIKYNEYFDFSPISPISRRTPQRAGDIVGARRAAGGCGDGLKNANNLATRTTPSYNGGGSSGGRNAVFKTPSSKQRVLQRTKLFNDQAFESTPTTDRLNCNL